MSKRTKLSIETRKKLFLNRTGEHKSVFNGDGLDFKEIREYDTSDDIRYINWKVTARTGVPSVNIFNEDKQLNIVIVYLNSGGISFGSHRSKEDVMVESLTLLGDLALRSNDTLTTMFFSDHEEVLSRQTRSKRAIDENIKIAYGLDSVGKSIDYDKLELTLMKKLKKRSIIFMVGDFLEMPSFNMLNKKHELYCLVVRDRLEDNLELRGDFSLVDNSTMKSSDVYLDSSTIAKYNSLMDKHNLELARYFTSQKIKNQKIYTSDSVIDKLIQLLRI